MSACSRPAVGVFTASRRRVHGQPSACSRRPAVGVFTAAVGVFTASRRRVHGQPSACSRSVVGMFTASRRRVHGQPSASSQPALGVCVAACRSLIRASVQRAYMRLLRAESKPRSWLASPKYLLNFNRNCTGNISGFSACSYMHVYFYINFI